MENEVCIVGLGYVGLPLAVAFAKAGLDVIGFDISGKRVSELKSGKDITGEVPDKDISSAKIDYSSDPSRIKESGFVIVAVPTPINKAKKPDLSIVESASKIVGQNLKKGAIVVFESTVYPGVTEDICAPIIEKESGLKCGEGFKIGYSPERVNPGDKEHTIEKIMKVVSGMDDETAEIIAEVYGKAITAGVFKAADIKTAEAAKVIENIQRDLNIALMNELSLIFKRLGIRTKNVIDAASTKWNFHRYSPGLVGGHCIGVDPYYLTYRAEELGYHPEVILAGRRINDWMAEHVADSCMNLLNKCGKVPKQSKVLVMGLSFKENVPDARNSKIKDTINKLKDSGVEVVGCDPIIEEGVADNEFGVKNIRFEDANGFDGIIVAALHREFTKLSISDIKSATSGSSFIADIKSFFMPEDAEKEGLEYWSL